MRSLLCRRLPDFRPFLKKHSLKSGLKLGIKYRSKIPLSFSPLLLQFASLSHTKAQSRTCYHSPNLPHSQTLTLTLSLTHTQLHSSSHILTLSLSQTRTYTHTHFYHPRHLSLVIKMFSEYGSIDKTDLFGTYRVELVVSLFARILDLHNFELVMHCLTPKEAAAVYCRVGW